jgi:osmotically inducible protein OsmC
MSLGSLLAGRGTPPERLDTTAVVTLLTGQMPAITSSELTVHGVVPNIDQAGFEAAAHEAERSCIVSRALSDSVRIRSHAILDSSRADVA